MGTVSYTYVTDIPRSVYAYLMPYRKLSWVNDMFNPFDEFPHTIEIGEVES